MADSLSPETAMIAWASRGSSDARKSGLINMEKVPEYMPLGTTVT